MRLALIRHGPTDWNEQRRIQGRADRRLSAAGRRAVAGWTLPEELRGFDWFVSPLVRARETAEILGLACTVAPALVEMDWGDWEGMRGAELRARYGAEFARRTARGLDMQPHGGESPRALRGRVGAWLAGRAAVGRPTGAVCHQGVIRAVLSLATGWDMVAEPPLGLEWAAAQIFTVDPAGPVTLERANVALEVVGGSDGRGREDT